MRYLVPILFVFVPAFASKEHVPLQNLPEHEKNLLFELVKRLEKGSDLGEPGWQEKAQCGVSTNTNSIIKKVDSVKNGAKFLTLHKDTETDEACSDLCCKNESCDLAVYENKGHHYCYLFQCAGKCKFGRHSSYISNTIVRPQQSPHAVNGPELDLINLDQDLDGSSSDEEDSFQPTTLAATTTTTTTTAQAPVYIRAHSVGLEGPVCERDVHCEDPNAVCNYHKCRCREGYYQKGHICRKVCPSSNFECLELGTHGRGPQCVSDIQVCDSVMQCADGSDEFNCPDSDGGRPDSTDQKPDTPSKAGDQAPEPAGDLSSLDDDDKKPNTHPDSLSAGSVASSNNKNSKPLDSINESHETVSDKDDSAKTSSADKTDNSSGKDSEKAEETKPPEDKGFNKKSNTQDLIQRQNAFISKVKLDLPKEPANMQGPIIALSLGLAFTVILLIFVACRLRNVRRRLRKGRPLHSNEADYLINGMYL